MNLISAISQYWLVSLIALIISFLGTIISATLIEYLSAKEKYGGSIVSSIISLIMCSILQISRLVFIITILAKIICILF